MFTVGGTEKTQKVDEWAASLPSIETILFQYSLQLRRLLGILNLSVHVFNAGKPHGSRIFVGLAVRALRLPNYS